MITTKYRRSPKINDAIALVGVLLALGGCVQITMVNAPPDGGALQVTVMQQFPLPTQSFTLEKVITSSLQPDTTPTWFITPSRTPISTLALSPTSPPSPTHTPTFTPTLTLTQTTTLTPTALPTLVAFINDISLPPKCQNEGYPAPSSWKRTDGLIRLNAENSRSPNGSIKQYRWNGTIDIEGVKDSIDKIGAIYEKVCDQTCILNLTLTIVDSLGLYGSQYFYHKYEYRINCP